MSLKEISEECRNPGRSRVPTSPRGARLLSSFCHARDRGQVLVLVALGLVALIGFVGLTVDIGSAWAARRRMQTAADAAATAGAIASRQGQSGSGVTTAADDAAILNGFTDGTNSVHVTVNPSYSGGSCSANCVQVTIDQAQPVYFLRVLGFSPIDVKASAVAGTTNSGSCIYGLGPTSPAFDAHGTASVSSSCGILVNSNANCGGNVTITTSMGVAGSSSSCPNSTTISYTPDPFAYLGSQPACSGIAVFIPNVSGAGSYCGGITIHNGANVTFSPGVYNLGSGGLTMTGGTVTGTGVTFISTAAITINGGTANLSAPTSDAYAGTADVKGILFWDTSTSNSKINGNGSSTFDGSLYFPQSQLTYNGTSSSGCGTSACSTGSTSGCGYTIIAADSVTFGGTTNFCNDYSSLSGDASPIESTTLYQ